MQNWYKNAFVDATMLFELPYMQIWTVLSNRSYTGFEPELLISEICLHTPWATEKNLPSTKTHIYEAGYVWNTVNLREKE